VKLIKSAREELIYYFSFPDEDLKGMDVNIQQSLFALQRLSLISKEAMQDKLSKEAETTLEKYYNLYLEKVYQK